YNLKQLHRWFPARQNADDAEAAAGAARPHRFRKRSGTADFNDVVDPVAPGRRAGRLAPVWNLAVVDRMICAKTPGSLEFFVATGSDDDPSACGFSQLQAKNR